MASAQNVVLQILRNTDDIAETLKQSLRVVATAVLLGALLAIVAGFLLASRALVPIRKAWDCQVEFVADASHELRTPLSTISANTELLLRDPSKLISDKAPVLSRMLSETRRMNRLVTHLLTLARSDSHLAQHAKSAYSVILSVDEERIRQLLFILLDNALKYTEPGGQIWMDVRRMGRRVEVDVKDTGCGIPREELPIIFHRFYRGDKSRSAETRSTGLGLAIAKWIAEAHHGTVKVKSEEGHGSTFTVILPVK